MSWEELLEELWAASSSAAVLILTALLLRRLFRDRTPRRVFCLLWDVSLARLLIWGALTAPAAIPPAGAVHPGIAPGLPAGACP